MNELQPLLDLLGGKAGWVATFVIWVGAMRTALGLFSGLIQKFLSGLVAKVVDSDDSDDDHWLEIVLSSPLYKFGAFLLNAFFSVKLPSSQTLKDALAAKAARPSGVSAAGIIKMLMLFLGLIVMFTPGMSCRRELAPDGIYAGDRVLADAENTIVHAYELGHGFILWEKAHRADLKFPPEATKLADALRDHLEDWIHNAIAARDAYVKLKNPENSDRLKSSIQVIRQTLNETMTFYTPK